MSDQAAELRQLMQTLAQRRGPMALHPRIVVVWGAQRQVGATAVAVNLAVELARHHRRVVLVDLQGDGNATRLCRSHEPAAAHRSGSIATLGDVCRGRRSLAEAIRRGAHGVRVVGNVGDDAAGFTPTDEEVDTLATALRSLAGETDLVLVDAGCGSSGAAERISRRADLLLIVTTPVDAAIMDAYAALKRRTTQHAVVQVAALLSRSASVDEAEDAFARLQQGCRRFLNLNVDWAGCVAEDPTVADAQSCAAPFVALSPRCEAARGIQQAAEYVLGALSGAAKRAATEKEVASATTASNSPSLLTAGEAA